MFWMILGILFMLYVIYSLSDIKYQLKMITKHLDVKEKDIYKITNEEIEIELEDEFKK
ncbi:hypothetical protein J2Z40_003520 [Cytobacillus eiseniae]|uniref:Uncharacterized protein n=1 Tax=Cytobacillus eiseniae TaxID=762947 RepID=A0ABS4RJ63_9BACI|nr:hypothetical protein [Cytobacillus eiseniae]MBP2242938.1 hypothetical protein [Cytobacillus eiseniae]